MTRRFTIYYKDLGYNRRRIIDRDRAWIEFVPKGDAGPAQHMFQHVTLLDEEDLEVERVLAEEGKSVDLKNYDIYSVYRTTCD